jgi:hypothetical protein
VEIPYQAAISHFRFPILSENQPENTLSRLAVDSAMPSIKPMTDLFTPRTFDKKSGIRGYIISELMSIKKLTSPLMYTFLQNPKNLLRFPMQILSYHEFFRTSRLRSFTLPHFCASQILRFPTFSLKTNAFEKTMPEGGVVFFHAISGSM